jgi:16S rRNA (uracil1498-N3)-methyltransferase
MTRRRWIADEVAGNRAALIGEHARHLSQTLRAQVGQEFDISTGTELRRGRISHIEVDRVEFELGEAVTHSAVVPITVALSIFKFDHMDWAIEKCTELGVSRIIPMIAARVEKSLAASAGKRLQRWQRIAMQASEQSRRISPPEISTPIKLKDLLAVPATSRIVLSEIEQSLMLKDAVPQHTKSLLLAFGPEGGWKEAELDVFSDAGWTSASLGNTILRTETAVIAAVAISASLLANSQEPRTKNQEPRTKNHAGSRRPDGGSLKPDA